MTENNQLTWARLPLQKAYNVRDLGGLPTEAGGQTLWRAFLRSDDIGALTEGDVSFLLDYGVGTVIDLRCRSEIERSPDRLGEENGVDNVNIPFMDEVDLSPPALAKNKNESMSELYIDLLGRRHVVRTLFETIANAKPGCVLFHCAVGKDRTGVLALLLLMLAGVDKRDCVNNYCQSYQNLLRNELYLLKKLPLNDSKAEYVEDAYHFVESHGGIDAYLEGCGLSEGVLNAVKARLVGGEH